MSTVLPVTVIIPSYNSGDYLTESVASVNAGTAPAEIIIIDDCSSDGSLELARALEREHGNVRVIARERNGGIAAARRDGIFAASQPWIALLDADDLLEENALALAHQTALAHDCDICILELWRFDAGRQWLYIENDPERFPVSGREAAFLTLGEWQIHPLGVSRKSVYVEAYQEFRETCTNADELITRLAFMSANRVCACKKKYLYRVNPTSITNTLHPRQLGLLDSCLWLIRFCENFNDAPVGKITRWGIEQSWFFYKKRKMLGCRDTKNKITYFIHKLCESGTLWSWIFRYPKHLAALIVLRVCCLGSHATE